MVIAEARRITFPSPSLSYSLPPPHVTSLLFDPNSLSLALQHSDTSFSLYPAFSSAASLPPPSVVVPAPTSSAAFFQLHSLSNPNPVSIFLTSAPFHGGTSVLLRFHIFDPTRKAFSKVKVRSSHRDLKVEESRFGAVFEVSHGISVRLEGGSNVFAMYSVSNAKIWVFAVKLVAEFEEVKLMKCAVIDCVSPVFSMSIAFSHLILGEENGVRVFPLRPLVKGTVKKEGRTGENGRRNVKLGNGFIHEIKGTDRAAYRNKNGLFGIACNDGVEGKTVKHSADSVKSRTVKLKQDAKEWGKCFVAFSIKEAEILTCPRVPVKPPKAVSIQALSPGKFLVLDSTGVLRLLCISGSARGAESPYEIKQFTQTMKVRNFAVLPGSQAIWICDGQYTVHVIVLADEETSLSEIDGTQITEAIFVSEKIQDIVLLSVDASLVLGQGSPSFVLEYLLELLVLLVIYAPKINGHFVVRSFLDDAHFEENLFLVASCGLELDIFILSIGSLSQQEYQARDPRDGAIGGDLHVEKFQGLIFPDMN